MPSFPVNAVRRLVVWSAAFAVLPAGRASAALGASASSVEADARAASGVSAGTESFGGYSVARIEMPSGTVVSEYVAPSDVVFAVAWHGPKPPDLVQLLGEHYPEVARALAARPRRRGPLFLRTDTVVLESQGHVRAFSGRAYLPAALPPAVAAESLR